MGNKKNSLWYFAISIAFVVIGLSLYQPWGVLEQCATYRFHCVEGFVVKVDLDRNGEIARVEYSYVVDGRRMFSDRLSYLVDDRESEFAPFRGKQPGDRVTVYYDAKRPDRCVLLQGFSDSAKFFAAWMAIASGGCIASLLSNIDAFRPKRVYLDRLRERVEYDGGVPRIRMTPSNLTPLTAGFLCFLIVGTLVFCLELIWLALTARQALAPALTVGLACGAFDFWFTKRGNDRGRWDLIVDLNRGVIQFPVLKIFGRPKVAFIADIAGFTCNPCGLRDDMHTNWALRVHVNEEGRKRSFIVAIAENTAELEALTDWIRETAGLTDVSPAEVFPDDPISLLAEI